MRPLRLQILGIGAFAGEENIPFEQMGEDGLYLITGDTGAGKTTIFDAICFALFGEVSGDVRESSSLRSDYAEPSQESHVTFSFCQNGKDYVVSRNPAYQRPRLRGQGTTLQAAGARLTMPDGTVVEGEREVTRRIEEILGLEREQFKQTAMIAQGEFLKLLLANTRDRSVIFRKIFGTGLYSKLQERLRQEEGERKRLCEETERSIRQYMTGIQIAPEDEICPETEAVSQMIGAGSLDEAEKLPDLLADWLKERKEKLEIFTREAAQLEETSRTVTEALTQVTQENRQREQLAKEEQVYEIYREQEEIQVGEQLYLEQAERVAAVCTPAWQQKRQAEEQLARQELRRQEKREQKERLEAQLPGLREARDQSRREEPKRQSIRDELTRRQAELPGRRTACVTLKKLQKEQTEAARNCRDSQNQYERLETEYRSKAAALESLQLAFYRQQAGILASQPEIGRPCPVCGSLEHPAPAVISGEAVEEERVHTAQREKDEALKRLQSLGLLLKEQQTLAGQLADRVKEAEAKREGWDEERLAEEEAAIRQTEVQLKQQEQQARENLHACEECEKQVLPLAGELENQDKQVQDAREMWEKSEQNWKQSLAALHLSDEAEYQKYVLTQTERARRRQACQEYRERGLTPEARLQKLREMLEEAEQLRKEQQYARLIEMRPDAQESEQENARIHADEGGADRMGVMTDQEKGNRAETANPAQLTSYQLETALKSRSAELTLRRRQLDREYSALSQRVASNERIAAQLKNQFAKRKQQMAEWEWYADLSRTAGGELKGQERLALEQYVQAFYFEQIVDRANRRFHEMSGGRYQLGRRQEASSRRSMAGLELEVMDYYTGKMRPVSSLSGGEAFQASLSLALGLSDVVQSMAGGIRIEAMFVDEGFGSLDRESMDLAISTLKGLSEEHFLVGIISHVEELKDRIERKIIVEKSPEGSHVRLSL